MNPPANEGCEQILEDLCSSSKQPGHDSQTLSAVYDKLEGLLSTPDVGDLKGKSLLMCWCTESAKHIQESALEFVLVLLEHGVKLNTPQDADGNTPLQAVVKNNKKLWFAALLLLYGANPEVDLPTNASKDLCSLIEGFKKGGDRVEILRELHSHKNFECFEWILEYYEGKSPNFHRDACLVLHLIKNISAEASSDNGFGNESLETVPQINRTDKDDPNEKFQKAFDAVRKVGEMTVIKRIQKKAFNLELKSEFEDQDTIIKRIAQTIIEERYKAPKDKTIPVQSEIKGFLGGQKYIHNGYLYKFAIPNDKRVKDGSLGSHKSDSGEYKSKKQQTAELVHEIAYGKGWDYIFKKVAGHELKTLSQLYKDINFPYMAVVDYLGYRLIAMTRLPISSRTLKEGMKIIRSLGKQLNLAPHRIYDRNFGDDTTPLPPDTELHVGEDGRMYLIDLTRVFPPVHNDEAKTKEHDSLDHTCYYQLFRPEFVASYETPLCSDVYSNFLYHEDQRKWIQETRKARLYLEKTKIFNFVDRFAEYCHYLLSLDLIGKKENKLTVPWVIHTEGINLRYMGNLYNELSVQHSSSSDPKIFEAMKLLLCEIIARTLKRLINHQVGKKLFQQKFPAVSPFQEAITEYLDKFVSQNEDTLKDVCREAQTYFQVESCMRSHVFMDDLKRHIFDPNACLGSNKRSSLSYTLGLACKMLGVTLTDETKNTWEELEKEGNISQLRFYKRESIKSLKMKLKHLPIVHEAKGYIAKYNNEDLRHDVKTQKAIRYFTKALVVHPTKNLGLRNVVELYAQGLWKPYLVRYANNRKADGDATDLSAAEVETTELMIGYLEFLIKDLTTHDYFTIAMFYRTMGDYTKAEINFLKSLELDVMHFTASIRYKEMLESLNMKAFANHFITWKHQERTNEFNLGPPIIDHSVSPVTPPPTRTTILPATAEIPYATVKLDENGYLISEG